MFMYYVALYSTYRQGERYVHIHERGSAHKGRVGIILGGRLTAYNHRNMRKRRMSLARTKNKLRSDRTFVLHTYTGDATTGKTDIFFSLAF